MNEKQLKMQKMGKTAYVTLKVFRVVLYIAVALLVALLFWLPTVGSSYLSSIGEINILPSPYVVLSPDGMVLPEIYVIVTEAIITAVIGIYMMYQAGLIFRSIANAESPFIVENVKHLKRIAWGIALMAVVPTVVSGMASVLLGGVTFSVNLELAYIVLTVLFFCLAAIFDYGAELQRESDETL